MPLSREWEEAPSDSSPESESESESDIPGSGTPGSVISVQLDETEQTDEISRSSSRSSSRSVLTLVSRLCCCCCGCGCDCCGCCCWPLRGCFRCLFAVGTASNLAKLKSVKYTCPDGVSCTDAGVRFLNKTPPACTSITANTRSVNKLFTVTSLTMRCCFLDINS